MTREQIRKRIEAAVEWSDYMAGMASSASLFGMDLLIEPCEELTTWSVHIGDASEPIADDEADSPDEAKAAAIDAAVEHFAEALGFFGMGVAEGHGAGRMVIHPKPNGRLIPAIKAVRDTIGCRLRDAGNYVRYATPLLVSGEQYAELSARLDDIGVTYRFEEGASG